MSLRLRSGDRGGPEDCLDEGERFPDADGWPESVARLLLRVRHDLNLWMSPRPLAIAAPPAAPRKTAFAAAASVHTAKLQL